ncbi:unnamed protein product [Rotaria sp. Silwood2]|nr:unnamed protein product [Rotaria sp. Silwood2]
MPDAKKDIERNKKQVMEKLQKGELITTEEPPSSSHGAFWECLWRIKNFKNEYQPFVKCKLCHEILSYSMVNGTSTISNHVKNCLNKFSKPNNNKTLDDFVSKAAQVNVSAEDKRLITVACAKFCSFDLRPFSIVKGVGFSTVCQSLINLGYQHGQAKLGVPSVNLLLPDPTNVSRTVSQIAEEYRENLKNMLKNDLQSVKLIGVSTDYWKNSGTSENYLTVNIHYSKNEQLVTYMLRTSLFNQSKTGENTRKKIFAILSSYDIDPNHFHVVYISDNGSNLVCGLQVHLRCICHCLNLALHNGVDMCLNMEKFIKFSQNLCTHFKRCEMNQYLTTSLKLNVDTRWNSIHDMLESISLNYEKCEDALLNRNEVNYLDDIDRKVVVSFVKFLSLFKVASEQLSADTTPTLHLVVPWFTKLKASCEPKDDEPILLIQFKNAVSKMLDEKIYLTPLHYIATFLYPTLSNSLRKEIYADTRKILRTLGIQEEDSSSATKMNDALNNSRKKKKNYFIVQNDVMQEFAGDVEQDQDSDDDSDEIDRYIKTKLSFSKDETLLGWWNKHSLIFPQLSQLAKSLFGVPASSATSERIFSSSGRILEKRRQSLKPDVVDDLLMIRNFREILDCFYFALYLKYIQ